MTMTKNRSVYAAIALCLTTACGHNQKPGPMTSPADAAAANGRSHPATTADVATLTAKANNDPILAPWTGPYGGVPPWDRVKADLFPKAFELGLSLLQAEIDVIASSSEPPTFANVFVPLENAGRHEGRAETLFGVMTNNLNTPDVQAVDREWS